MGTTADSDLRDIDLTLLDGTATTFGALAPGAALVVNVASKCGFTPQYEGLEALHREFGPRGLTVIGMPCNQFALEEPGTAEEIREFCTLNYGVTFPLLTKGRVNGPRAELLFRRLRKAKDEKGAAGLVRWNFEKFLVGVEEEGTGAGGKGSRRTLTRFRSAVKPDSLALRDAIEAALGGA